MGEAALGVQRDEGERSASRHHLTRTAVDHVKTQGTPPQLTGRAAAAAATDAGGGFFVGAGRVPGGPARSHPTAAPLVHRRPPHRPAAARHSSMVEAIRCGQHVTAVRSYTLETLGPQQRTQQVIPLADVEIRPHHAQERVVIVGRIHVHLSAPILGSGKNPQLRVAVTVTGSWAGP